MCGVQCVAGYGCSTCDILLDYTTGSNRSLSIGSGSVDLCSVPYGGGTCTSDLNCVHGYCINGRCKCWQGKRAPLTNRALSAAHVMAAPFNAVNVLVWCAGWGCSFCSLSIDQDITAGAGCKQFVNGGSRCLTDSECGHGTCSSGKCMCEASYACGRCSALVQDLVTGAMMSVIGAAVCATCLLSLLGA